jgi:ubiquinone/menaquinone biosynthesis C-methylase UbiE
LRDKIEAFNMVADSYDDWYNHPQGRQVFQAERNAIHNMIPASGLGVEIGAGTGIFAESLTEDYRSIICLDPSVKMLVKAKTRGLTCILGYGDSLPFRKDTLDFAYMVTVLEFIAEPVEVFKEIKQTVKEKAPLSMLFINADSSWGKLYREIGSKGDPVFKHAKLYTHEEVNRLLDLAGYRITSALGTLNSDPMNQNVDGTLVEPSPRSGVIVIKALRLKN